MSGTSTTQSNGNKNTQCRMISDGHSLQNVSLVAAMSTAELWVDKIEINIIIVQALFSQSLKG
jgi:hypothetical protein